MLQHTSFKNVSLYITSLYILLLFLQNRFLRQYYLVKMCMSFCLDIPSHSPERLQQLTLPTICTSMFTHIPMSTLNQYLKFSYQVPASFHVFTSHLEFLFCELHIQILCSTSFPHPTHSRDIQVLFIMQQQIFFLTRLSQDFVVNFVFYNSYFSAKVKAGYFPYQLLGFLPYSGRALLP